jgi:hypothetical protein
MVHVYPNSAKRESQGVAGEFGGFLIGSIGLFGVKKVLLWRFATVCFCFFRQLRQETLFARFRA